MILVITHNGKLPKDGGKRIGYQSGDALFSLATGQAHSVSALLAQQVRVQAPPEEQSQSYWDLEFSYRRNHGPYYCRSCDGERISTVQSMTDAGSRKLYICKDCGFKMR